ncbi:hypothetical protein ACT8O7_05885, partial [Ornithobacterium rhinotracheale]
NQKSELINVFRDNPNKKFIEFEVRTELEKLPIDSPIKTKDKVRVYKEEVYKIISDGNSNFGEVLDYKEIFK